MFNQRMFEQKHVSSGARVQKSTYPALHPWRALRQAQCDTSGRQRSGGLDVGTPAHYGYDIIFS